MNCPFCNVALKSSAHRGLAVDYCPLCGGTWLDRATLDRLPLAAQATRSAPRLTPRLVRIALLTGLLLTGCLIATISFGAAKLWPTVRGWAEALLSGNGNAVTAQVREMTGRLGTPLLSRLRQAGLDNAAVSALVGNSGFEGLIGSLAVTPELGRLVQNGLYLKVLQEGARQNVQNLADLKTDAIVPAEVRAAAEQIQQVLRRSPGGGGAIGAVDPGVIELLGTEAFQQLCGTGFFDARAGGARPGDPED